MKDTMESRMVQRAARSRFRRMSQVVNVIMQHAS
jgi:hypothetical protein